VSRGDWRRAEDYAAAWLRRRGWRILARNWRWRRLELDIVAARGDTVAFVEVKMASRGSRTMIPEKLDRRKRDHLASAAAAFLARRGLSAVCRFDLAEVRGEPGGFSMDYLAGAFRPGGDWTV
jgi:putative endonuclease